jgi:hypothetical protein
LTVTFNRRLSWAVVPLLTMACASAPRLSAELSPRNYTQGEVAQIMNLRENGESLADVAAEVGGTRQSVRLAERQELARRRGQKTASTTPTAFAQQ